MTDSSYRCLESITEHSFALEEGDIANILWIPSGVSAQTNDAGYTVPVEVCNLLRTPQDQLSLVEPLDLSYKITNE